MTTMQDQNDFGGEKETSEISETTASAERLLSRDDSKQESSPRETDQAAMNIPSSMASSPNPEENQGTTADDKRKPAKCQSSKQLVIGIIAVAVVVVASIAIGSWVSFSNNSSNYDKAKDALENGDYSQASEMFAALGNFSDAASYATECDAIALYNEGKYSQALEKFNELGDFDKALSYAEIIPTESTIVYISALCKDTMKNPDSFELRGAWEDFESEILDDIPIVVLKIQGTNSYGASISNYWLTSRTSTSKSDEWIVQDAFSDLDEETYGRYTSSARKKEIETENSLKWGIKYTMTTGNEIDESVIDRVNDLNDKDLLDKKSIELVDASKKLTAETDA